MHFQEKKKKKTTERSKIDLDASAHLHDLQGRGRGTAGRQKIALCLSHHSIWKGEVEKKLELRFMPQIRWRGRQAKSKVRRWRNSCPPKTQNKNTQKKKKENPPNTRKKTERSGRPTSLVEVGSLPTSPLPVLLKRGLKVKPPRSKTSGFRGVF